MGFYIGSILHTKHERIAYIESIAKEVPRPKKWDTSKANDEALVCIVDNGNFVACAICCDDSDFEKFVAREDARPKKFYVGKKKEIFDACDNKESIWEEEKAKKQ